MRKISSPFLEFLCNSHERGGSVFTSFDYVLTGALAVWRRQNQLRRLIIPAILRTSMTNWEMCEEVTFRCPDCGHRQARMTPECPACGTSRTVPVPSGGSVHEVCFGLNGGQRREWYRMVLTGEHAGSL